MGGNTWFLTRQLAITDFKLRYSNSVLGYLWSLLNPLLMFSVLYVVFSVFMRFDMVEHYQLYLLLGIILWNYFSEATTGGMHSMLYKSSLISKINFPKVIIIIASNITSILTLLLNLLIFAALFLFSGVRTSPIALMIFLEIVLLIAFAFSVSLVLSAFYLRFRDLSHLWGVLLQISFWLTPVVYPLGLVPERIKQLILLNPMARIIMDSRNVLIYNTMPQARHIIITVLLIALTLAVGLHIFNKRSARFAEEI